MTYLLFLIFSVLLSLIETAISARNSKKLLERGAIEIGPQLFPLMAFLYIALYFGSALEYFLIPKDISSEYMFAMFSLLAVAKGLKVWTIRSLGKFWTMRLLVLPGSHVVTQGPYRYVKHPNYVAVLLEIAAIALAGKSIITFLIIFSLFCWILYYRVVSEEQALVQHTDYSQNMISKRRFIP